MIPLRCTHGEPLVVSVADSVDEGCPLFRCMKAPCSNQHSVLTVIWFESCWVLANRVEVVHRLHGSMVVFFGLISTCQSGLQASKYAKREVRPEEGLIRQIVPEWESPQRAIEDTQEPSQVKKHLGLAFWWVPFFFLEIVSFQLAMSCGFPVLANAAGCPHWLQPPPLRGWAVKSQVLGSLWKTKDLYGTLKM